MARGKTVLQLLDDLRAETGQSLNPAHNIQMREMQLQRLQRVQEWLWDDFAWPHLRVEIQVPVAVGQRFYGLPSVLVPERLERIDVFRDGFWRMMHPDVTERMLSCYNSDLGQEAYPPQAWRLAVDPARADQIEVWPVPNLAADPTTQDGTLKFVGIRTLSRFVDEKDTCDLDGRLIVLYAAAETLASNGDKSATLKLNQAQARYQRFRGDLSKNTRFQMFGTADRGAPRRAFVGTYRPPFIPGS